MSIRYFNILMNHLEKMQFEVAAASFDEYGGVEEGRPDIYDCNRALLVTGGSGLLHIDDRSFPMIAGTFSFLLAGKAHWIEAKRGEKLSYWWCHFRASYSDRALYQAIGMPEHVRIPDLGKATAMFARIRANLLSAQPTARLRIKTSFMELISIYIDHFVAASEHRAPLSPEIEKLETVLCYVDEHLVDTITVEDLAGLIYLHPNYFIVFFKGLMGCSPIQYVNQRRLEVARTLLADPSSNVSDVAARIGMKIYYFSRMFKAYTGLTPSRYKKLVLGYGAGGGAAKEDAGTAESQDQEGGEA
ncbi:helix-turn-helix transcriptional regulator [Cohnella sp. JJ-181]|uniref:helix-turn-helix transcriptional regulator n=1 Tax=Cohnella rhizoplanae TaxID=2974897 RepID=UPI0022FF8E40|nr:AraC family transcriptional regulator [Cohnella sp. JJ-181]CAI6065271.1 HTH-type transcriptional activator RhaR [Cohnella sp. JJ-181]